MPTAPAPIPAELVEEQPLDPAAIRTALAVGLTPEEGVEAPSEVATVAAWTPGDDGAAEWLARLLAAAEADLAAVTAQADAWRAPINQWEADQSAEPARVIAWATALLEDYALGERAAGGRKTIALPSARLSTREVNKGGRIAVEDEETVVEWAGDNLPSDVYEEIVQTKPKVMLGPLRKRLVVTEVEDRRDDGTPIVDVIDGEEVPRMILVAVDPDSGEVVPGLTVEPAYFSPSVATAS